MPEKQFPPPRFAETPAEREERLYQERRARSAAKVAEHFPVTMAKVRKAEEVFGKHGIKVRVVGAIEDGKIIGRMEKDTVADQERKNGGPLKRISPDPDKED